MEESILTVHTVNSPLSREELEEYEQGNHSLDEINRQPSDACHPTFICVTLMLYLMCHSIVCLTWCWCFMTPMPLFSTCKEW
jgi:hypothetical protein